MINCILHVGGFTTVITTPSLQEQIQMPDPTRAVLSFTSAKKWGQPEQVHSEELKWWNFLLERQINEDTYEYRFIEQ